MKILFLTNNEISYGLFNWLLKEKNEDILMIQEKIDIDKIKNFQPEMIISYNYKYIIKKDIIDSMNNRIINLHVSYLPWNRGASPNLWSFLEDTPKGVTIHLIDEDLDSGGILLQKEVHFDEHKDTLKSSYGRLHDEIQKLFKENWEKIKNNQILPKPQIGIGSIHSVRDSQDIINLIENWEIGILELKKVYQLYKGGFFNE